MLKVLVVDGTGTEGGVPEDKMLDGVESETFVCFLLLTVEAGGEATDTSVYLEAVEALSLMRESDS